MKSPRGEVVVAARSTEGNLELVSMLRGHGIPSVGVETISFKEPEDWGAVDDAIRNVAGFDWVVFTSAKGADAFFHRREHLGLRGALPSLAAVGPGTRRAITEHGHDAEFVPKKFTTRELADSLPADKGKKVLLMRADIAGTVLPEVLRERGFAVTDVAVYRTQAVLGKVDPKVIEGARAVLFASPSEVRGFLGRLSETDAGRFRETASAICLGPVTAEEARNSGFIAVETADGQTLESLVLKTQEVIENA